MLVSRVQTAADDSQEALLTAGRGTLPTHYCAVRLAYLCCQLVYILPRLCLLDLDLFAGCPFSPPSIKLHVPPTQAVFCRGKKYRCSCDLSGGVCRVFHSFMFDTSIFHQLMAFDPQAFKFTEGLVSRYKSNGAKAPLLTTAKWGHLPSEVSCITQTDS
jgi:hypothetical protein